MPMEMHLRKTITATATRTTGSPIYEEIKRIRGPAVGGTQQGKLESPLRRIERLIDTTQNVGHLQQQAPIEKQVPYRASRRSRED